MADGFTTVSTRRFAAERANFVVRCSATAVRDAVEALFVDLQNGSEATEPIEVLLVENADGTFTLSVQGEPELANQSPDMALAGLVTAVSRLSLDADPNRLHLHCAALSLGGRGALISAASGTGKTTLAAALAQRGWTYVSDEAVGFHERGLVGTGFAKPLMIKPGGVDLFPELSAARVTLDSEVSQWRHVPVSAMGGAIADQIEPALVVILQRAADGSTEAHPVSTHLHPADAVVQLMGQTMDAQRFGPHAIDVLAGIAAKSRCITLRVGPLGAAAEVLREFVSSPAETHPLRVLEVADRVDSPCRIAEPVRSLLVADRAVVHDTSGGVIVALDEAGTMVWLALHSDPPAWWDAEAFNDPGIIAFLDQLESHGLISQLAANETTGS
jgi:hypothetical protein